MWPRGLDGRKSVSAQHVRNERLWERNGAGRILMVFEQRDQDWGARGRRIVQGVRVEERPAGAPNGMGRAAHANVRAARLEVAERRAGVGLAVGVSPRHPGLDLVLSRLAE